MHTSTGNAHLAHGAALWALEIGLSLVALGYVFRGVLDFAIWTLEFLWT